ncbi:MAG: hypothetical protein ACREMH_06625 [Gemmatimonadales bacterium]
MPRNATPSDPYLDTTGGAGEPGRRLLVVSYHFPPSPAVGGLRWQRLSWLAAERGWAIDVIARDPAELGGGDASRLQDTPRGLRAYGVRTPPLRLDALEDAVASQLRRLRSRKGSRPSSATLAGADAPRSYSRSDITWRADRVTLARTWHAWRSVQVERAWAGVAAELGTRLALRRGGDHRAVISCGPPHEVHSAGLWIAERTGLPLVLDLRDPWSLQQRLSHGVASPLWFTLAERHEANAVARAALVVCNTEPAAEAMRRRYPAARVMAVMNGMDDGELPASTAAARFVVGYAGAIYLDRDPRPLLQAAGKVARELRLTPERFGIEFIGEANRYDGQSLDGFTREAGISEFVHFGARRPYAEAMAFLASCAMLVSLPQDSTLAIPSKVFEYLRFPAWLLALAESGSATARVLEGTGADVVAPDDVDGIAAAIRRRYLQFAAGETPRPLDFDPRLTRRHQGGLLLNALEEITSA